MKISRGVVRTSLVALLIPMLLTMTPVTSAHNLARTKVDLPPTRFDGRVTAVSGPSANPYAFSIQLKNGRFVDFNVGSRAVFTARSAEAEVEGFCLGDFAVVTADRMNKAWVAQNITYDVAPMKPIKTLIVSGQVSRWSADNTRFEMRLDAGGTKWITPDSKTRVRLDNQPATLAVIVRGVSVNVILQKPAQDWLVAEIDVRSAGR